MLKDQIQELENINEGLDKRREKTGDAYIMAIANKRKEELEKLKQSMTEHENNL